MKSPKPLMGLAGNYPPPIQETRKTRPLPRSTGSGGAALPPLDGGGEWMARGLPDEPYMTLEEVAKKANTSKRTIKREIERGHLRCTLVGGQYRFDPRDVLEWLGRRRKE